MLEELIAWMLRNYLKILILSFGAGALSVAVPRYFEAKKNIEMQKAKLARLEAKLYG